MTTMVSDDGMFSVPAYSLGSVYYVPSASAPDKTYMVVIPDGDYPAYCSCPAFKYHGGDCKHIRTVRTALGETQ